jgi:CheY-like chemotaxis protein
MKESEINILLVEDNSDHRLLAQMAVNRLNMNIKLTVCQNGEEALELLERKHFCPDIALLDVELMHDLDGFDIAQWIRKNPHLNNTDIIYYTGYESPEYKALARETGAFDYILKNEDMSVTVTKLKQVIGDWSNKKRFERA